MWLDTARYYAALVPDRFTEPDRDGLAEHFEAVCATPAGPDRLRLVALAGGGVAGFLLATLHRPGPDARHHFIRAARETTLSVDSLAVAERARRGGVATALMDAAHEWAAGRGALAATLETYGGSPLSVPFYERRMGYARRGIIFDRSL